LGIDGVSDVRQGKRFEIALDGDVDADRRAELERIAEELLSNPVIEDYTLRIEP
jgi:phosphoribosylformylglycinamidine synthase PurS subunit